jgi:hypothetical protein
MTDEKFEEFLKQAARDYHAPPETPRAEMWARIDEARAKRRGERELERQSRPWVHWAAGIAAILVLGIGIGRMTAPGAEPIGGAAVASTTDELAEDDNLVFRFAATEYFENTEAFLALFRVEARAGQADAEVGTWARDLLATARLMMDSPAADDPIVKELFEDLELILVQISQYPSHQSTEELELIEQGIEERSVHLRLQAASARGDELMAQGAI